MRGTGPHAQMVVSSRLRLARNVKGYRFPHAATHRELAGVRRVVELAAAKAPFLIQAAAVPLAELAAVDRRVLMERHLISRVHTQPEAGERGVIIGDREMIAVMINEEDHVRLQVLQSGLNLREGYAIAEALDRQLEQNLAYAFSREWGYLTACPTNVGTALRASAMLHLPALVMTGQIRRALHAISKMGFTSRGLYGEGTEATGNFFQISNRASLGRSEADLLGALERLVLQVIAEEAAAREAVLRSHRESLEDRIWRAYGTLRSARVITSAEAADLLSLVRLGVDMGMIPALDRAMVNTFLITTQPAHLQKWEGRALTARERDVLRAQFLRQHFTMTGGAKDA